MLPMTITIATISEQHEQVHAVLDLTAPSIGATARIAMAFAPRADTGPADWREEAYDRALMMLDPA